MIIESHNLLIGESAGREIVEETEKLIREDEDVHEVQMPLTMQLSPDEVLLALNLEFKKELTGAQVAGSIKRLEKNIKEKFPQIKQIYIEAAHLSKN
jgi:divalent metal cation (Fe/Co/Zn/Cd) transporter